MTIQEAIQKVFPQGTLNYAENGQFEVNGLKKETQPAEGIVILSGLDSFTPKDERRIWYVTDIGPYRLAFRICTAHPTSGYDEFVRGKWSTRENKEVVEWVQKRLLT